MSFTPLCFKILTQQNRANNGSCVEDMRKNFKDIIFEGIERFVPHKILKPNPDLEYYNGSESTKSKGQKSIQ
jgi:hypothetical protein